MAYDWATGSIPPDFMDEALARIATALAIAASRYGRVLHVGRASNEAAFLYQFVRTG